MGQLSCTRQRGGLAKQQRSDRTCPFKWDMLLCHFHATYNNIRVEFLTFLSNFLHDQLLWSLCRCDVRQAVYSDLTLSHTHSEQWLCSFHFHRLLKPHISSFFHPHQSLNSSFCPPFPSASPHFSPSLAFYPPPSPPLRSSTRHHRTRNYSRFPAPSGTNVIKS